MGFKNEKISEEDIQKYGIREINKRVNKSDVNSEWTIDIDRDIYLRWMRNDREMQGRSDFNFYWKGTLFDISLKRCVTGDGKGLGGSSTWAIWAYNGRPDLWLPETIEKYRKEIVADLKDALVTFGEFGTYSKISNYSIHFEF